MAKRGREVDDMIDRARATIHFDHHRPVPSPDDGPLLLWDILEKEVPSHADLATLVSYGETAKRLADVWRAHVKKLPAAALCRARGKLHLFPHLTQLCIPGVENSEDRLTALDVAALRQLETLVADDWYYQGEAGALNGMLARLPNLTQLSFREVWVDLVAFSNLPRLRELDIRMCTLSPFDGAGVFKNLPSLVALNLDFAFGNARSVSNDLLVDCPGLLYLNISYNATNLTPEVLAPLINLTYLDVRHCDTLADDYLAPLVQLRVLLLGETQEGVTTDVLRPLVALEMVFWAQYTNFKQLPFEVASKRDDLSWTICESDNAEEWMYPLFVKQTKRRGLNPFFDFNGH